MNTEDEFENEIGGEIHGEIEDSTGGQIQEEVLPAGPDRSELEAPAQVAAEVNSPGPRRCEPRERETQPGEPRLEDHFDSNYRYVLVAARRARQLQSGSHPLVSSRSTKACRVAQEEIAAGAVKYVRPDEPDRAGPKPPDSLVNTYQS